MKTIQHKVKEKGLRVEPFSFLSSLKLLRVSRC